MLLTLFPFLIGSYSRLFIWFLDLLAFFCTVWRFSFRNGIGLQYSN
jgi:hypothetical protein